MGNRVDCKGRPSFPLPQLFPLRDLKKAVSFELMEEDTVVEEEVVIKTDDINGLKKEKEEKKEGKRGEREGKEEKERGKKR